MSFGQLAQNIRKISISQILQDIISESSTQQIIKDTIKNRIQTSGKTATNQELRTDRAEQGEVYNAFTIDVKEQGSGISSITSHVTLTQGGQFWESLRISLITYGFRTEADFIKEEGHMFKNFTFTYGSQKEFEDDVIGLSENELREIWTNYLEPKLIKRINETI
jgi:hypothetical protein